PPPAEGPKRPAGLEMTSKFGVPRLLLGYNTARSSDPDCPALSVLEGVLGGGKTSRLYKGLVEGAEVASSASANHSAGRYPGWFALQVELLPGNDPDRVEKLVLEEVRRLRDQPVSAGELKRAQHALLAGAVFARESVHGLADNIARGVTTNDLDFVKNYLPRVLAV